MQRQELQVLLVQVVVLRRKGIRLADLLTFYKVVTYKVLQILHRFQHNLLVPYREHPELFELVRSDVEQLLPADLIVREGLHVVVHRVVEACINE